MTTLEPVGAENCKLKPLVVIFNPVETILTILETVIGRTASVALLLVIVPPLLETKTR